MYDILRHLHSVNRWVVLGLLIVTLVGAIMKMNSGKSYSEGDRKQALFTLIFSHLQLVMGVILLFVGQKANFEEGWIKQEVFRYFGMEHSMMMIIGIILITIGYSVAKRKTESKAKFKTIAIFFGIALVVILSRVPFPPLHGTGWY